MWFFGVGASNYGHELLHQALDLWYNFMEATRKAVFDWYTVKGSDSSEGQKERDLLQEHHNLAIKRIHNGRLSHFDSKFMREAVSLNIVPLTNIANTIKEKLGLCCTQSGHSSADLTADINLLAQSYIAQGHHIYNPHCSQSFLAIDALSHGLSKLHNNVLQGFVSKNVV